MMARLEYFIVCESSSVDAETNQLSLFHIFDDVFPDSYPYSLPRIDAVGLWILDEVDEQKDLQAILRISPPGIANAPEFSMNFAKGGRRFRALLSVINIPLKQSGDLLFEVLLNGHHQASHTVTVHEIGTPPEEVEFHPLVEPE